MKKLLILLSIFISVLCLPIDRLQAEEINSFDSTITVEKDGTFRVSERLEYDFGTAQKHGMYRLIQFITRNAEGKKFALDFDNYQIFDAKKTPYIFSVSTDGEYKKIKIGDPNTYLTGVQTYILEYTVRGGFTYFSDHDELYWQITGTNWSIPITAASVKITFPTPIDKESFRVSCFVGGKDSSSEDCTWEYENGVIQISAAKKLASFEGFTVVVGFPKNIISVLEPKQVSTWLSDMLTILAGILAVFFFIGWYLVFPIWIVVHWYQTGRDPKPLMGVTSAWFDVPKTKKLRPLTPGETGTLIDETADMHEISATIVDLGRRGYIKIVEKKKNDFYIEKTAKQSHNDTLQEFEKILYDGIFDSKKEVRIKDAKLISVVSKTKKQLYESVVKEQFFEANPESIRTKYSVIGGLALFTFNIPLALSAFIFGRAMPKKTIFGSQSAAIAKSLKNFIVSQERQYAYQANNQLFFEKFLPYAVVFGVEKIWAKRFQDIGLKNPDWYQGYNSRSFNSMVFIHSLNSSLQSISTVATPTSSSTGHSSGFSGGSVGGGGGGGGGGSW